MMRESVGRTPNRHNKTWTEGEVQAALRLDKKGHSRTEIARAVERTTASVMSLISREKKRIGEPARRPELTYIGAGKTEGRTFTVETEFEVGDMVQVLRREGPRVKLWSAQPGQVTAVHGSGAGSTYDIEYVMGKKTVSRVGKEGVRPWPVEGQNKLGKDSPLVKEFKERGNGEEKEGENPLGLTPDGGFKDFSKRVELPGTPALDYVHDPLDSEFAGPAPDLPEPTGKKVEIKKTPLDDVLAQAVGRCATDPDAIPTAVQLTALDLLSRIRKGEVKDWEAFATTRTLGVLMRAWETFQDEGDEE